MRQRLFSFGDEDTSNLFGGKFTAFLGAAVCALELPRQVKDVFWCRFSR
jgi:hypothetical protein